MRSVLRDRRTAGVSEAPPDDDEPQFDGYAVELLNAVADLLSIHLEFYAVEPHAASSARGRTTHDYGMWSPLVDQLLAEAKSTTVLSLTHLFCFNRPVIKFHNVP